MSNSKASKSLEFKFNQILAQIRSLIFNSNYVPNFEKTPMRKFVPCLNIYMSIFYFEIFEQ
jgi:hypothetical protein